MVLTPEDEVRLHAEDISAPTGNAVAISVVPIAASVGYCALAALDDQFIPAMACSPFFAGAIVGLFAYPRPIRAAMTMMLVALVVGVVTLREAVLYFLFVLVFALPFVVPMVILGALCASTVRRHLRGRRARILLGL